MPPELLSAKTREPARIGETSALRAEIDVLRDRATVVRNVDLTVRTGAALGIVGRNGVGKTSLLAGVMGLLPTTGTVHLDGIDISGWPTHRRAIHGVALVPQGRRLFADLSVADNLRTATVSRSADGPTFDVFELFPNLRGLLGRRAGVLSGGQQQQVAIARAILRRPRLLLLDEPTEGLAPGVIDEVVQALAALRAGGLTLVLAEQRLDVVRTLCDQIAVMRAGEVAAQGHTDAPEICALLHTL